MKILIGNVPKTLFLIAIIFWAHSANAVNRGKIVFLEVECKREDSGGIFRPKASGFVISKNGHVLTAAHVLHCKYQTNSNSSFKRGEILAVRGIVGHVEGSNQLKRLSIIEQGHGSIDIALLKFKSGRRDYDSMQLCALYDIPTNKDFKAYGFAEGEEFAITGGTFGGEVSGGLWNGSSAFTFGMSGGPVMISNIAVGVVKGGVGRELARRRISPIHRVKSMIEDATGILVKRCPILPEIASWNQTDNKMNITEVETVRNSTSRVFFSDNRARVTLSLPRWLVQSSEPKSWGTNFTSGSSGVQVDTLRFSEPKDCIGSRLYEMASKRPKWPQKFSVVGNHGHMSGSSGKEWFWVKLVRKNGACQGVSVTVSHDSPELREIGEEIYNSMKVQ